ncbi:MAG: thermonuclease family protein [Bacillota bacterium]
MSYRSKTYFKLTLAGILGLAIIFLTGCQAPDYMEDVPPAGRAAEEGEWVTVARVVDGDTFVTGDRVRVRLIGVDTPEITKRHEPYGQEAAAFARDRLEGQRVWLEFDVEKADKYGRTLAYVYLADGTFFNALLLEEGYAQIMTVPPNVKYAEEFLALQREARENNKGLWGK